MLGRAFILLTLAAVALGATNLPPTPRSIGLEPPSPVAVSYDVDRHITTWSDGTKTTNTPKRVTLKVTYIDSLTSNAIYEASFTTEYRATCFMKTEIIEE